MAVAARDSSIRNYLVQVFWSEEDEAFIANVPDLEFCSAFGASPEEAIRELEAAAEAWLSAAQDQGLPIPQPSFHPVTAQ